MTCIQVSATGWRRSSTSPPSRSTPVPYSVAWPDRILAISASLWRAADAVVADDADFAAFLRQRSRDLLTDDNEAGDAAWVRGSFGRLDVVVGAYEQYDDDLFGAKAFFGLALLLRDEVGTAELKERFTYLQAIEDALPIDRHRLVSVDVPVGSFDVVAAFGQGVEVNAEILPNDPTLTRKYGRKILLRRNFVMHPAVVARLERRWRAAMAPAHQDELTAEGLFRQTTWHEVGHYLGPDTQRSGQTLDHALAEDASIIEELKSELLSTFACHWLEGVGAYTPDDVRGVAAAALLGSLRPVRPLRSQPYPTLWVMRLNQALECGYLRIEDDGLHIEHDRLADSVTSMLRETLAIQDGGTRANSSAFIERYSTWDERHERIAAALRATEQHRFVLPRFAVLDGSSAVGSSDPSGVRGRRGRPRRRQRSLPGGSAGRPTRRPARCSASVRRIGSHTIPNQMPAVATALEDRDEAGRGLLDLGRGVEALLLGEDRVRLQRERHGHGRERGLALEVELLGRELLDLAPDRGQLRLDGQDVLDRGGLIHDRLERALRCLQVRDPRSEVDDLGRDVLGRRPLREDLLADRAEARERLVPARRRDPVRHRCLGARRSSPNRSEPLV